MKPDYVSYLPGLTEKMKLAMQICRLAEVLYKHGIEPDQAMVMCRAYFCEVSSPLFHAAARESLDMMAINPNWGK